MTVLASKKPPLDDTALELFRSGRHSHLHEVLGAHVEQHGGDGGSQTGTRFAVWAPHAETVSVIGEWNHWRPGEHPLARDPASGIWEGFIPGVGPGSLYKYRVTAHGGEHQLDKTDPFGRHHQTSPQTASVVWVDDYAWNDGGWMRRRAERQSHEAPISIYEVHLGSWRRGPGGRFLSYREIAPRLAEHVRDLGFTHVELLPVMEHPFYGSWGYQTTGYFAPTSRHGTPDDFRALVDELHRSGLGVILDWVPSHFPEDAHSLAFFDGTHLFEHGDPRRGRHPDWDSLIFDYGRGEVRSFLLSSALFWLESFHTDGLRVDAVASMLYLDYSRQPGEWIPNIHGGRENLDAITFLRQLNDTVHHELEGVLTIAEESTAWPMVSRPTSVGGLGFDMKWDMGWMNDTLEYLRRDPIHRRHHHDQLTFRTMYAFSESFCLALSHDEVVHGKGSLLNKMPGDEWQKRANLRLLYGYQIAQPGKKLLFMGAELASWKEWAHEGELEWSLEKEDPHAGIQRWLRDVFRLYAERPALHELDHRREGFEWIDCCDLENGVVSLLRLGARKSDVMLIVLHFTPQVLDNYRIGAPAGGIWREVLNSDAHAYGGSDVGNYGQVEASPLPMHGREFSLTLRIPPLAVMFFEPQGETPPESEAAAAEPPAEGG